MPGPDLHQLALDLLIAVEASFLANNRPVPDRRYVAEGQVSADGEQLVVEIELVGLGAPARPHVGTVDNGVGYYVQLVVWSMRPAAPFDGETFPSPDQLNASSQAIHGDGSAVLQAVRSYAKGRSTSLLGQTFTGPQGGLTISRTALQAQP